MMSRLDLKVVPSRNKTIVLAESEYGEAAVEVEREFTNLMIDDSNRLRDRYLGALHGREQELDSETANFGKTLFSGFITDDVLTLFNRSVGGSREGKLDIRLLLGEPRLNVIQWELMRSKDEYIGFQHNMIRHPFISRPAKRATKSSKKTRALIVGVDPVYGPDTIREEHFFITGLLNKMSEQVEVIPLYQEDATLDNIIDAMFSGVDMFHFNGHGFFNDNNPAESYLVVWGQPNEPGRLYVKTIRTLVTAQTVGFCFLNACSTARTANETSPADRRLGAHFVSVAHSLIEAGVPIVLATNHEISIAAATKFSRRFYTSILKYGRRVDDAVREGRAELFMGSETNFFASDWSCPVLYVRSSDLGLGFQTTAWENTLNLHHVQRVERPVPSVQIVA
jgi:hypothetical protein